jgi:tRNA dimethylallyltransferase
MKEKQLIVLVGPTAIGKTKIAIHLAQHFNCEILSADSRQFFKELTIGTAKPSEEELLAAKHHFINSHSIKQEYNVGKFEEEAIQLLDKLFLTYNKAILVGGSGLYIDAICKGFDELPKANKAIRLQLEKQLESEGIEGLQSLLKKLDIEYYRKVDLQNPQRIMRALEVCLSTGKTYTTFRSGTVKKRNFKIIKIGLTCDRNKLYEQINVRVDKMIVDGLLNEVKNLIPFKSLNALQTVGYKEVFEYFDAIRTLPETIELIKKNTRNYAKRQLTWFKKDKSTMWFHPSEIGKIISLITSTID